jgi:2-dehydro-3-deoxyphosphogluconate aldolase/(4S)-4-hydroxy-2-oxoglutarate aldolase
MRVADAATVTPFMERFVHYLGYHHSPMQRADIVARIERERIVAVIRLDDPDNLRAVVDALAAGGVRVFEVTMTVPRAIDLIGRLARQLHGDVLIGAGTVLDKDTACEAINAGAKFVVGPVFRRDLIDACHGRDVPAIPGCFSPTEILDAWDAGADIVKVFPSTSLGPAFIKDVRAPLPHLKLMPTGGVSIENAADWLRAGAVAVGVGSALVDATAVRAGDFASISQRAERLVANVQAIRLKPDSTSARSA